MGNCHISWKSPKCAISYIPRKAYVIRNLITICHNMLYTDGRSGGIFGSDRRLLTIYGMAQIDRYFWTLVLGTSSKNESPLSPDMEIDLTIPRIQVELLPRSNSGGSGNDGHSSESRKPNTGNPKLHRPKSKKNNPRTVSNPQWAGRSPF